MSEIMNVNDSWDLSVFTNDHIESYLLNYKLLIKDLSELADMWADMDDFEHHHYTKRTSKFQSSPSSE
jgi:hypothetical protein